MKRTRDARSFFEKGDKAKTRSSGLSVIEKPNLSRTRILSVVRRASVVNRADSARKKFSMQDSENAHQYKPVDCPGCGTTVYFRERYKGQWHRRCYEVDQSISKTGAKVCTPYGPATILSSSSDQVVVDLGWGKAYLQKDYVCPTTDTIDAFVAQEKTDFEGGMKLFQSMEKDSTRLNPQCPGCGDAVFLAEPHEKLGGHLWHKECFQCQICSLKLNKTFKAHERKPMCYRCYEEEVLVDYFCAVLDAVDVECEIPPNYLSKLQITDAIWDLLNLMNKNRVKFFTIIVQGETALAPEKVLMKGSKDVQDCGPSMFEEKKRRKFTRSGLTTGKEFAKFWEVLVSTAVPKIGIIHMVFKLNALEDVSRICEKVVCCVYIPEDACVKEKLLYGATAGILHNDAPSVSKVITSSRKEDFLFANVLAVCRKDFKY